MITRLPSITEKEFVAQVVQLARLRNWLVYHTHDSRHSASGFPDLVLVRERVVYVECKRDTGKVTVEQQKWLDRLQQAGAEAHVWRPSLWAWIEEVLK